ncbi:MAG: phage shock protein A [Patiriisocius sp.]|jgi:phage shock protein A
MNVLKRIIDAVRGGALGIAELVSDANGIAALEQQLFEVEDNLNQVKHELTEVMAKQMRASREIAGLQISISEKETEVSAALDRLDEAEALKIAEKISALDKDLESQQQVHTIFLGHVARLRALVSKTERQVKDYQRQLHMVKTTESLQKASTAIAENFSANKGKMHSARDSLDLIQQRQQRSLDLLEAEAELNQETEDKTLDERLEMAGISDATISAQAVLDRIRSRRS